MLRDLGLSVAYPRRTFATVDHIVPTDQRTEPFSDPLADEMIKELRKNCAQFGITYFDIPSGKQGIVHVVGPEQGVTQPGTTIACGDSHTSTHGAFGAIAFGIGTSQVRDVLATQTMAIGKLKVRRINVNGKLPAGTYAKDLILHLIRKLGVNGGNGFAYEYGGEVFDRFTMEERMTVCNMSIEGGARIGYVNPDETTYAYLEGRPYSPKGSEWKKQSSAGNRKFQIPTASMTMLSSSTLRKLSRQSPGVSILVRPFLFQSTTRARNSNGRSACITRRSAGSYEIATGASN